MERELRVIYSPFLSFLVFLVGYMYVCAYNHVPCHSLGYDLWVPAPILFGHKVFLIYPQKKRHARTSCNLPLYMKRHWSSLFQKSIKRPQLRTNSCGYSAEFLFAWHMSALCQLHLPQQRSNLRLIGPIYEFLRYTANQSLNGVLQKVGGVLQPSLEGETEAKE